MGPTLQTPGKKLFIIKAGSSFGDTAARFGDFDDMIRQGLDLPHDCVHVVNAYEGESLPEAAECLGIVITGAHCMVTDNLPWSLAIEAWIPALIDAEVPFLGICYGHQLLGRAMGGTVENHPRGKEVGTFDITLSPACEDDPLFSALPQHFPVHATHTQSVTMLPPGAVLLAGNDFEPHHAMRMGPCAWGVQFHPEYNVPVIKDYIRAQAEDLSRAGQQVDILLDMVRETPHASSLLSKFAALATVRK